MYRDISTWDIIVTIYMLSSHLFEVSQFLNTEVNMFCLESSFLRNLSVRYVYDDLMKVVTGDTWDTRVSGAVHSNGTKLNQVSTNQLCLLWSQADTRFHSPPPPLHPVPGTQAVTGAQWVESIVDMWHNMMRSVSILCVSLCPAYRATNSSLTDQTAAPSNIL